MGNVVNRTQHHRHPEEERQGQARCQVVMSAGLNGVFWDGQSMCCSFTGLKQRDTPAGGRDMILR
jgi:hypothetical protein